MKNIFFFLGATFNIAVALNLALVVFGYDCAVELSPFVLFSFLCNNAIVGFTILKFDHSQGIKFIKLFILLMMNSVPIVFLGAVVNGRIIQLADGTYVNALTSSILGHGYMPFFSYLYFILMIVNAGVLIKFLFSKKI